MNEDKKQIFIIKTNGTREPFDSKKLYRSLIVAGATDLEANEVVDHIERELEEGMTTNIIFEHALNLLRRIKKPIAARYSLKRAIAELGPSGFPFEKFIAELFKVRGFNVETNQFVYGKCAQHEIDVVMWNDEKLLMAEAKFHNELGIKSDMKVALYIKARFDDIKSEPQFYGRKRMLDEGMLITNTKFTDKAIKYSQCAGIKLMGWNYPKEKNLHSLIEDLALHPVTCLSTLSAQEKKSLLDKGIVLCRDVRQDHVLEDIGLPSSKMKDVLEESNYICPV